VPLSQAVRRILSFYEADGPGTKANLARILMHGRLGGTGRLLILPVDQGFEHDRREASRPTRPRMSPTTSSGWPSRPG
jgi:class I fructose-bisphosphate aldolase